MLRAEEALEIRVLRLQGKRIRESVEDARGEIGV